MDGLLTVMQPSCKRRVWNIAFTTRSSRIRGLYPDTVPFRRMITLYRIVRTDAEHPLRPWSLLIPYGYDRCR